MEVGHQMHYPLGNGHLFFAWLIYCHEPYSNFCIAQDNLIDNLNGPVGSLRYLLKPV